MVPHGAFHRPSVPAARAAREEGDAEVYLACVAAKGKSEHACWRIFFAPRAVERARATLTDAYH